jgi:hypothetical protein
MSVLLTIPELRGIIIPKICPSCGIIPGNFPVRINYSGTEKE